MNNVAGSPRLTTSPWPALPVPLGQCSEDVPPCDATHLGGGTRRAVRMGALRRLGPAWCCREVTH